MESALYFPYMRVPESAWFAQILLYWDHAETIIPAAVLEQELAHSRYMNSLHDEGLLSFVDPTETLWRQADYHDAFIMNFLKVVDSIPPTTRLHHQRIHADKMVWSLFNELRRRGLATTGPRPEDQVWWQVEGRTASLYMAFLATALSSWERSNNDVKAFPVTDGAQPLEWLVAEPTATEAKLGILRYRVITQVLPAPAHPVPAQELRRFKEDHNEQLQRLRRHLDLKLVELTDVEDKAARRIRLKLIREEIEDDLQGLREQMERRQWPKVVLYGFGGILATGLVVASTAVTAGANALALGLAAGSGIVSGTPPVLDAIRSSRGPERAPLAYAAIAAEKFGVP